jgi:hypothetical protein
MRFPTTSGPLSQWLFTARKRRAVRRYLKALPKQLFEDYGHRGPYTPGQVESSIGRAKLSAEFCPYAQAIFCDSAALPSGRHDFRAIRHELGRTYFTDGAGGGGEYTYAEVSRLVGEPGGYGGHGDGGASGGEAGHHGGDGGGHH